MPYGSALLPRPASLEILIPSRSPLWPLLRPLCSGHLHFGRPPLRDVVPSQALLLSPGPSSMVAAMALPLPGTSVLSYRASSAWCPASCGLPHQAHWSPFQGSFLSLTVEGISLFPGGWVTRYRLGSLTHAGLTAASIFPWENIHRLLLSFARLQSWGGIVSVFLPHGPQGAPKEKPVTGSVPYASACNGRQVPWAAA